MCYVLHVNWPGLNPCLSPSPSGRVLKVMVFQDSWGFCQRLQHDCLQHQLLKPRESLDLFVGPGWLP